MKNQIFLLTENNFSLAEPDNSAKIEKPIGIRKKIILF